ncbi:hypothetical protein DL96DRAFT_1501659 [Flagelloscypha sp. PMI_526]|nr:hypothetical protein DL96DRAFT_1501659 [Flagelloscypha sp. PMI_526]
MAELELRRVPELWYYNGGIVLQAGRSLFCVNQEILSTQSSVFRDLFAFAQPGNDTGDTYHGHPLIVLHDDETELQSFLKAVFNSTFIPDLPDEEAFLQLPGVLRLSHKYDNVALKCLTLEHLRNRFFTSDSLYSLIGDQTIAAMRNPTMIIRMVPILIETEALWLVPRLLLFLELNYRELGATLAHEWSGQPFLLQKFLRGMELNSTFMHDALDKINYSCLDEDSLCQQNINFLRGYASSQATYPSPTSQASILPSKLDKRKLKDSPAEQSLPLTAMMQLDRVNRKLDSFNARFPNGCFEKIKLQFTELLRRSWDHCPEFYGLPSWTKLCEMRAKLENKDD